MIVLGTHIWVWSVSGSDRLTEAQRREIEAAAQGGNQNGNGGSVSSCWEVAKLVEVGRLAFDRYEHVETVT